jgi:hypothetical protein
MGAGWQWQAVKNLPVRGNTFKNVGTLKSGPGRTKSNSCCRKPAGLDIGMAVADGTLQFWDIERTTL